MLRYALIAVLLSLSLFANVASAQSAYRYQAFIDLDRNPASGCDLQTPAGLVIGKELLIVAKADREQINSVSIERCEQGLWSAFELSPTALPHGLGQGELGSDLLEWSVPRHWFGANTQVDVSLLAEADDGGAFDWIGDAGQFASLTLGLPPLAASIPALQPGMLVLLIAALWLVLRRKNLTAVGQGSRLPVAVLALGVGFCAASISLSGRVVAQAPLADSTVVASDAGNDAVGSDAALDLLGAEIDADLERVRFSLQINNLEADGLIDQGRVLFLGNSLTYSNDLPLILQAIALQAGKRLHVASVTRPNVSLEDLYLEGEAQAEIAHGDYDLVVMQQGPSSLEENQLLLLRWARNFNNHIRASGARPALYMVWPDASRSRFFDAVRDSYMNAAIAVDGMFIPAGETWRAAWRIDPLLPLYAGDQFHPSKLGSYAAALSMFAEIYRQTPVGLPSTVQRADGSVLEFSDEVARILQASAWSAHLQYGIAGH